MVQSTSPFAIRNIQLFIVFRILFNARFYYPVFTILFLDYGLTIEQFALLNTVWAVTIVCAEVPSGALADIIGRKRLLTATSVLMVCELSLLAFVPLTSSSVVFTAFLLNRILSGLAEAMASGADEAIAYDSLIHHGNPEDWPRVLSVQMRLQSLSAIITASLGALVYDPAMMNRILHWSGISQTLSQQTTMRFPIYLTLLLSLLAVATTLSFQEQNSNGQQPLNTASDGLHKKIRAALRVTVQAGRWILHTPFALAVIAFGMFFDHILRMIVTMASQYFRLIELPEASFGLISASLSLLGLLTPKIAEKMVQHNSPQRNVAYLFLITITGFLGLTGFFPYFGLLPMALVFIAIKLVAFFTSHYLNRLTDSQQRATVLSFKGLAFNLAYGLIGVFFALLVQQLRSQAGQFHPEWSQAQLDNNSFIEAIGWFPGYTMLLFLLLLLLFWQHVRSNGAYLHKG